MATMNEAEATFINTFLSRDKRERWLSFLSTAAGRTKLVNRLAHNLIDDLDPRFVFDEAILPLPVAAQAKQVLDTWTQQNPGQRCAILAVNSEVDGTTMRLAEAQADERLTFGAVIVVVPNRLAYYRTERSNLNRQPYYLLYHP